MFQASIPASSKPLPLKQRTSSLDTRRDYSHSTWWSLLGLLKPREYFVTVDNFSIWRRHLAWAMENGKDLRGYMTQRYGSSMVFMSLLLSTELSVLFNSAPVTTRVRDALREGHHNEISFWAGFLIMISALLTLLSLIALFTAWGMVNSIDEVNMHCIFRSSIGQYAAELPGRLIVCSIYAFLTSFMIFFFLLLPIGPWSIALSLSALFLFIHIVSTFSAFGRVIMHSGAMGSARIFAPEDEESLLPRTLHSNLLTKAKDNLAKNASIIRQYRRKQQQPSPPVDRRHMMMTEETMSSATLTTEPTMPTSIGYRPRADSTVRFSTDLEQENGGRNFHYSPTLTPLSDSSSVRTDDYSPSPHGPPIQQSHSSLRRSSYGGPRKSPIQQQRHPPLPPPSSLHSKDVSSSSIDQWLQNAQGVGSSSSTPLPSQFPGADGGNDSDSYRSFPQSNQSSPVHIMLGASSGTKSSNPTRSSTSSRNKANHRNSKSLDDRYLSEDERFALDYGDIHDNVADAFYSPLRFDPERAIDDDETEIDGTERQSLIGASTSPTQYYSELGTNSKK